MDTYGLMICDDEWMIREQITRSAREMGGFTIYTADSGLAALEILAQYPVDGVILDVRMPEMDGITLLQQMRAQGKDCVVIILSGHDEFEYARQCLHYGAAEYLLKPVTDLEIKNLLADLKERIQRKRFYTEMLQEYSQKLDEMKPILKEQFFRELLQKSLSEEEVRQMEAFLDVRILFPYLTVAAVRIQMAEQGTREGVQERDSRWRYAAGKLLEAQLGEKLNVTLFHMEGEILTIIAGGTAENLDMELADTMEKLLDTMAEDLFIHIYAGIGNTISSPGQMRNSYTQALYALNSCDVEQDTGIVHIRDVVEEENCGNDVQDLCGTLRELAASAAVTNNQELAQKLKMILNFVCEKEMDLDRTIYYCSYLAVIALDRLDSQRKLLKQNPLHEIVSGTTPEEVCRSTNRLIDTTSRMLAVDKQNRIRHLADTCRRIIERDYSKKIGVMEIATQMGVSSNYLSTIFRRETQYSINEYLNAVRLNHAKKFLRDTNLKVYEIAEKTGFSDAYYFSSVFKRNIGVTPSEYRNSL